VSLVVEHFSELAITRVSRWCFNCYLVTGDDGELVVVDAGMPDIAEDLVPLGVTWDPLLLAPRRPGAPKANYSPGGAISDHVTDTLDRFAVLDDEHGRDRM
jgi:hypothetical protein